MRKILEANRPAAGTRDARPAKPDHAKLAAALAAGLKLDKAKVTAALAKLDAARGDDHEARHEAEYAAIAKALGVDADDVKAAFEAVRPAPRRRAGLAESAPGRTLGRPAVGRRQSRARGQVPGGAAVGGAQTSRWRISSWTR